MKPLYVFGWIKIYVIYSDTWDNIDFRVKVISCSILLIDWLNTAGIKLVNFRTVIVTECRNMLMQLTSQCHYCCQHVPINCTVRFLKCWRCAQRIDCRGTQCIVRCFLQFLTTVYQSQLSKKFSFFCRTQRSSPMFPRAYHWTLIWPALIQSTHPVF